MLRCHIPKYKCVRCLIFYKFLFSLSYQALTKHRLVFKILNMKKVIYLNLFIFLFLLISLPEANAILCLKSEQIVGDSCVEIKLKNGKIYKGKLLENNAIRVRFSTCAPGNGSILNINKADVVSITSSDKKIVYKQDEDGRTPNFQKEKRSDFDQKNENLFAIASIISTGLSILSFGIKGLPIILYFVGFICNIVALAQIRKFPNVYKGKWKSILLLIVQILGLIAVVVYYIIS